MQHMFISNWMVITTQLKYTVAINFFLKGSYMNKNFLFIPVIFILFSCICNTQPYQAFCKTAVADIVSIPLGNEVSSFDQIKTAYDNLPASWGPSESDLLACPRIHQLLLHEIVTVLEETNYEAYIEITPLFIARDEQTVQPLQGWVFKEHLRALSSDCLPFLPQPIDWQSGIINDDEYIVALISPFVDHDNKLYSAGTRFILSNKSDDFFHVIAFDKQINTFKEISIPQDACAYQPLLTEYDKRMLFCTLIGLWSEIPDLKIPLVWGGASIGSVYRANDYYADEREVNGQKLHVWERPKYGISFLMGLDASNLVSRAAQLVGIPYFSKNSFTASLILDELGSTEYPLEGDLIWMPGSLLIIKSIQNNTIVTTMSYSAGYGTLLELPLAAVFENIYNFNDLLAARTAHMPLTVLNSNGSTARIVEEFKILKLM